MSKIEEIVRVSEKYICFVITLFFISGMLHT